MLVSSTAFLFILSYIYIYIHTYFLTAVKSKHKSDCSQMLFEKQNRTKGKRNKEIRKYLPVKSRFFPLKKPLKTNKENLTNL